MSYDREAAELVEEALIGARFTAGWAKVDKLVWVSMAPNPHGIADTRYRGGRKTKLWKMNQLQHAVHVDDATVLDGPILLPLCGRTPQHGWISGLDVPRCELCERMSCDDHTRAALLKRVVIADSGCWVWQGSLATCGYGRFSFRGRCRRAHAVSYELHVGPIPEGLELDHLCRNHACVNPSHLEPVTRQENTLRGISFAATNAKKTHCIRGHVFDEANTVRDSKGSRVCLACRAFYSKQRSEARHGSR